MATLSAEQFQQLIATITQQMGLAQGQPNNNSAAAILASSLDSRIGQFNYDPESGSTFETWHKRYGNFIEKDGDSLEDSAKVRLLVGKLGDAEYSKFADSILPKTPDDLKYADAIKKLKDLFADSRSLFVRRFECFQMKQAQGQDIASFIGQVNAACENADLTLSKETLKCLIMVVGLRDEFHDIRQKCLQLLEEAHKKKEDMQLETLGEECRAFQLIRDSAKSLSSSHHPSVNAINNFPQKWKERNEKGQPKGNARPQNLHGSGHQRRNQRPRNSENANSMADSNSVSSEKPNIPCQSCGQMGHSRQKCKHRQATCYSCGKIGHISTVCRSKQTQKSTNFVEINSVSVNAAQNFDNSEWFWVPIWINGIECTMKMDTASQAALFTKATWAKLGKPTLGKADIRAISCNGQKFKVLGKFQCSASFNGQAKCNLIGYVAKDVVHDLLGIPWIMALKILPNGLLNSKQSMPNENTIYSRPKIQKGENGHSGRNGPQKFASKGNDNTGFRPREQSPKEFADKRAHQKQFKDKSGAKPIKFSPGESIYLLNFRNGNIHWLPGEVIERVEKSPNYCIWVPSIGHHVRRHPKQMRKMRAVKFADQKEQEFEEIAEMASSIPPSSPSSEQFANDNLFEFDANMVQEDDPPEGDEPAEKLE